MNKGLHPQLRLRITADAERQIRSGHPWLFAKSIREINREGESGELAVIYGRDNRFLAIGLFVPDSPLRVRVLHCGKPVSIDADWWRHRLDATLRRRRGLFDEQTTGYRLINGESDGWPGLVLDRYDTTLVVKLYTEAWLTRLAQIVGLFRDELGPERIVLRLSRNIPALAQARFKLSDAQLLFGDPVQTLPIFLETGLRFEVDVMRGQKTGFFLDQRENRRVVESLARGRTVLNAFSFSGGFSVYAARGKAVAVTDLDISGHALAGAKRNFALNKGRPEVSGCSHETIQVDAFQWLEQNGDRQFDLVILDPPSLAKRESDRVGAIRVYGQLAAAGIKHLRRGGVLVAASCSAHVNAPEFQNAVRGAARKSRRSFAELQATGHPADHPATFPEAHYLKCLYLKL